MKSGVLTQSGVNLLQGRTYLPQAYAKCGCCVSVRAWYPIRFPGRYPRPGHKTGQQYSQRRDTEHDACPGHVLRRSAHRAHHTAIACVHVAVQDRYRRIRFSGSFAFVAPPAAESSSRAHVHRAAVFARHNVHTNQHAMHLRNKNTESVL